MKKLTVLTYKGYIHFNADKVADKGYRRLGELEHERVSTSKLFDDVYIQDVAGYTLAKFIIESRKKPDSTVVADLVDQRTTEDMTPDEVLLLEEKVYNELQLLAGTSTKTVLVAIGGGKILLDCDRNTSDVILGELLDLVEGEYEDIKLLKTEAARTEKMLTNFVLHEDKMPDPFTLGEVVHLGEKSLVDKKPKSANIKISKVYASNSEVVTHITNKNMVKLLEVEWDGVIDVHIDNTLFLSMNKYKEDFNFKADPDTSDAVNFMTEYNLKLPAITSIIDALVEVYEGTSY